MHTAHVSPVIEQEHSPADLYDVSEILRFWCRGHRSLSSLVSVMLRPWPRLVESLRPASRPYDCISWPSEHLTRWQLLHVLLSVPPTEAGLGEVERDAARLGLTELIDNARRHIDPIPWLC